MWVEKEEEKEVKDGKGFKMNLDYPDAEERKTAQMMIKKIEQMDLPKERKDVFINLYALSDQMYQIYGK